MAEIWVTPKGGIVVKRKGTFDLDEFYKALKHWFDINGFKEFSEIEYVERIKTGGKQYEIVWVATKNETNYFQFVIKTEILVLGLNKVEVQTEQGKKLKLDNGQIEVRFYSYIVTDPKGLFKNEVKFFKRLKYLYEGHLAKKRTNALAILLYQKIYSLQGFAKDYFDKNMF